MQTLSEREMIAAIAAEELFEAELESGSFRIKIEEYVPYICTAIHAGHLMLDELAEKCLLSSSQRLMEEDPFTDDLISSFPITLVAQDSRYEYDLNRDPENCIYESAWGQKVWGSPLSESEKQFPREKHSSYYRILKHLLSALEKKFGGALLLDLHSYNWKIRNHKVAPVFNIGTKQVNLRRWKNTILKLEKHLSTIPLPNLDTDVKRNSVFLGMGYQAAFVREHLQDTLIIPLEVKKIFMDEETGELFPLVLEELQRGLHISVLEAAATFNSTLKRSRLKKRELLPPDLEPIILTVDKALFKLSRNIETLHYVNPINIQQEKRRFFTRKDYLPDFCYRQLRIDPYSFQEKLYKLPVSEINDPLIRGLYRSVVEASATKVEMLAKVGTPQFLYNSLRYYGKPDTDDIANARFLLHAGNLPLETNNRQKISAEQAKPIFEEAVERLGIQCKVVLSSRLVANAMVDNSRRMLMISRNARLTRMEIEALIHHELGVHMLTTYNALQQPLHMLRLGLPGSSHTQEGLAVLSEYISGNINLNRLQTLSLRVLAVDMMIQGMNFGSVYHRLIEEYSIKTDVAFNLTTRIFRGGGFTKDYLYLKGFRDLLALYRSKDITALLVGKTGIQFHDTLNSLIDRKILHAPKYISPAFINPSKVETPVLDYLVSSIK